MQVVTLPDPAPAAAALIADRIRAAVSRRGHATVALSGGSSPGPMLRALAAMTLPWDRVSLLQVDERFAPDGDPDRNWPSIVAALGRVVAPANSHPMPAGGAAGPAAAAAYAEVLHDLAGNPPALDVVHLGLGDDGHTASLVPGDAAVDATADVAVTGRYRGRRRLTLTLPTINRAGTICWFVPGPAKRPVLQRLLDQDPAIPASRVRRDGDVWVYATG